MANALTLTVMPLRKDAPIYIDDKTRVGFGDAGQVARVNGVRVMPQYALEVGGTADR